jgi:transposase
MNTTNMNSHLRQISRNKRDYFVVMVLDGASSHGSKSLVIPENIALISLPPYSPELNPTEQIWRVLRKKEFYNIHFNHLDEAIEAARRGLRSLASNKSAIIKLCNWPWIKNIFPNK